MAVTTEDQTGALQQDWLQQAEAALRSGGQRLTAGRHLILAVLAASPRHLSAAEIRTEILSRGARLDLATTHRTVRNLARAGLIHVLSVSTDAGSLNLFGRVDQSHQHVACTMCGDLRDVSTLSSPTQLAELARAGGVADPSLIVLGTCEDCASGARTEGDAAGNPRPDQLRIGRNVP